MLDADTDIHIPFFARGPGIPRGGVVNGVTTHTDVSSTLLEIACIRKELDGIAMSLQTVGDDIDRYEHASIEYWGPVRQLTLFIYACAHQFPGHSRRYLWRSWR